MRRVLLLILVILISFQTIFARTIRVPGDSATIQAGINGADSGDTVMVGDGVYSGEGNGNMSFLGKAIVLTSENGPEYTIVKVSDDYKGTLFYFSSNEDTTSQIQNITFRGPFSFYDFSIAINSASPLISNCCFEGNRNGTAGGGIFCRKSNAVFRDCRYFSINSNESGGALTLIDSCCPQLSNCVFFDNSAYYYGGAIYCDSSSSPSLFNCNFVGNYANMGSSVACHANSSPLFENCLFAYDLSAKVIHCRSDDCLPQLFCCNIFNLLESGWTGCIADQESLNSNMSERPYFCDVGELEFTVLEGSPCLPENNDCGELIGAFGEGCSAEYRTWRVFPDGSGDVSTIQQAIDSAIHGDTIMLYDGIYSGDGNRDLHLKEKTLIITTLNGPDYTILDLEGSSENRHYGLWAEIGVDTNTVIEGVTFKNGYNYFGSGIFCHYSSPTIRNCKFVENLADNTYGEGYGAGVSLRYSQSRVESCYFADNTAQSSGGGICCYKSEAIIDGCVFVRNFGNNASAIAVMWQPAHVSNCTIFGDTVGGSDLNGVIGISHTDAYFDNCLIAFNTGGTAVHTFGTAANPIINCCNFYGNANGDWTELIADQLAQNGNMSENPCFCDTSALNLFLAEYSPCLTANNSCGENMGALGLGCSHHYVCGDANGDRNVNLLDVLLMVTHLYGVPQGAAPNPPEAGDANADGAINLLDVLYLIDYLYGVPQGPEPLCP